MGDKIKAVIRETQRVTAAVGGRDTTPAKWRGKWQPEERYGTLHKVEHLGSSYVCIKACVGVDPEADVTLGNGVEGNCWILIAKRGEDGAPFSYDMFTEEQLEALRGPEGPAGKDGKDGKDGQDGQDGSPGPAGPAGSVGPTGPQGPAGPQGPQGERGPAGPAGSGTGDMVATMYDPQGKRTDIFKYVDDKTKDIDVDVTADEVTFADGETFQQKYDSGDLTGPAGPTGPQGPAGKNGQDGQPGATGADGQPGAAGKDATINGVNALTIQGGDGIEATMSGNTLTIKAKTVETWTFTLEDDTTVTKKVVLV